MLRSFVQTQGISSLTDSAVAERLGLNESQIDDIKRLRAENAKAMQEEVWRQAKNKMSRKNKNRSNNAHAILLQFHREAQQRVLEILTPSQREQFDRLRYPEQPTAFRCAPVLDTQSASLAVQTA